jgi:hypothetical protein
LRNCTERDNETPINTVGSIPHMVPIDRPGVNDHLVAPRDFTDQFSRPKPNVPNQHRVSIFGDPHDMVLTVPDHMAARFRRLHRMLRIPSPKGEGFTDPQKGTLN